MFPRGDLLSKGTLVSARRQQELDGTEPGVSNGGSAPLETIDDRRREGGSRWASRHLDRTLISSLFLDRTRCAAQPGSECGTHWVDSGRPTTMPCRTGLLRLYTTRCCVRQAYTKHARWFKLKSGIAITITDGVVLSSRIKVGVF